MEHSDDKFPEIKVQMSEAEWQLLPEDMRGAWELKDGVYVAHPDLAASIEEQDAAFAASMAEKDAEISVLDTKIGQLKSQLFNHKADSAVNEALAAAGCRPGLMRAALKMFRAMHNLECSDDGTFLVDGVEGQIDLPSAVALWTETADGQVFLREPRPDPGRLH